MVLLCFAAYCNHCDYLLFYSWQNQSFSSAFLSGWEVGEKDREFYWKDRRIEDLKELLKREVPNG